MQTTYKVKLEGIRPLLMHCDDVERTDDVNLWRKDSANKDMKVAGDDRSPAWTWMTYLYHDGKKVTMPSANIMSCLKYAGMQKAMSGRKTFKQATQVGILITDEFTTFRFNGGRDLLVEKLQGIQDKPFKEQKELVQSNLGFTLDVRRARIKNAKHVRVRPRFENWSVEFEMLVTHELLTRSTLTELFGIAGRLGGLGDWRPSSKDAPGSFGMFTATLK